MSYSKTYNMVTQMYAFSTSQWPSQKGLSNGNARRSNLVHVGFPGLSLTPIQESPLLDSLLSDEMQHEHGHLRHSHTYGGSSERDHWLPHDDDIEKSWRRNSSLPPHWFTDSVKLDPTKKDFIMEVGEHVKGEKNGVSSPLKPLTSSLTTSSPTKACSVNVRVVHTTTFFPKDEPMSRQQKRTYICKLLLFAFVGFLIIAGIVLWIFSPAFT